MPTVHPRGSRKRLEEYDTAHATGDDLEAPTSPRGDAPAVDLGGEPATLNDEEMAPQIPGVFW